MDSSIISPVSFFLQGAALGLAAAATPGVFQAYLISQSILYGFSRGVRIAFAPLISDPPIVITILLLLNQVSQHFLRIISVAGGFFILYMALGLFKQWRTSSTNRIEVNQNHGGNFLRGVILNMLTPGLYLYWTLVNGPLLISAWKQSILHAFLFLLGFYVFFIGGMVMIAALFSQTRRLGQNFIRIMLLVSAIILAFFGIYLIFHSLL